MTITNDTTNPAGAGASSSTTITTTSLTTTATASSPSSTPIAESLIEAIPLALPLLTSSRCFIPLTPNGSSWIIHIRNFFRPPNRTTFQRFFKCHPSHYHTLRVYGRDVYENRYSQLYVRQQKDYTNESIGISGDVEQNTVGCNDDGNNTSSNSLNATIASSSSSSLKTSSTTKVTSYAYSGTSRPCIPLDPTLEDQEFIIALCHVADVLVDHLMKQNVVPPKHSRPQQQQQQLKSQQDPEEQKDSKDDLLPPQSLYNLCLMNWYQPDHSIGLHSDDEREMDRSVPIISLSWGGPRRFLLRPKKYPSTNGSTTTTTTTTKEILLGDGDLLLMGGKCQDEFKHEIPKVRKKDGLVGDRISWTIRCIRNNPSSNGNNNNGSSESSYNGIINGDSTSRRDGSSAVGNRAIYNKTAVINQRSMKRSSPASIRTKRKLEDYFEKKK